MRWTTTVAICGGALLVVAAACVSQIAGTPSAGDHPPVPTVSTTAPPAVSTTTPTVAAPTTTGGLTVAQCTVRDLDVSLVGEEGTAGTMYRALVFTNTGTRACVIQGFPGVSFVAGDDGHQVGEAAARVGDKGPPITLRPGMAATAPVGFVNIGNYDPEVCQPTPVRGLRVYPPHERRSVFVPFETTGCAGDLLGNQLTVRTVHKGAGLT
jgi:hypothetical protein